jgi:hypothetical protein
MKTRLLIVAAVMVTIGGLTLSGDVAPARGKATTWPWASILIPSVGAASTVFVKEAGTSPALADGPVKSSPVAVIAVEPEDAAGRSQKDAAKDAFDRAKQKLDEKLKAQRSVDEATRSKKISAEIAILDDLKQKLESEIQAEQGKSNMPSTTSKPSLVAAPAASAETTKTPVAPPAGPVAQKSPTKPEPGMDKTSLPTATVVVAEGTMPGPVKDSSKEGSRGLMASKQEELDAKLEQRRKMREEAAAKEKHSATCAVAIVKSPQATQTPATCKNAPGIVAPTTPQVVVEKSAAEPAKPAVVAKVEHLDGLDVRKTVDQLLAGVGEKARTVEISIQDNIRDVRPDFVPAAEAKAPEATATAAPDYVGEWKDGQMQGYGSFTYADGRKYTGEWVGGRMEGQGEFSAPNGWKYAGQWHAGKVEGHGALTHPAGWKYVGQWLDGQRSGEGALTCNDGWSYTGGWLKGRMNGKGSLVQADSGKFNGTWQEGKRSGQGTLIYPDGWQYDGQWANDVMEGQGKLQHPSGWTYVGEWRAGKRDGTGMMTYPDGWQYEGNWANDMMEGRGKLSLPKGWSYVGEWHAGKMSGNGEAVLRSTTTSADK